MTKQTVPGANADDPTADRRAAYPDAGELNPTQDANPSAGSSRGRDSAPIGPDETGTSTDFVMGQGVIGSEGGPQATRDPDEGVDPGQPGHDQPAEGERPEAADGGEGTMLDRLDR